MLPNSMEVVASDGLLLVTIHVYALHAFTVSVWVYCAVTESFNTVSFPSVTVVESLVQVTVVAGPPVEIQVRVLKSGSKCPTSRYYNIPFYGIILKGMCQ